MKFYLHCILKFPLVHGSSRFSCGSLMIFDSLCRMSTFYSWRSHISLDKSNDNIYIKNGKQVTSDWLHGIRVQGLFIYGFICHKLCFIQVYIVRALRLTKWLPMYVISTLHRILLFENLVIVDKRCNWYCEKQMAEKNGWSDFISDLILPSLIYFRLVQFGQFIVLTAWNKRNITLYDEQWFLLKCIWFWQNVVTQQSAVRTMRCCQQGTHEMSVFVTWHLFYLLGWIFCIFVNIFTHFVDM